MSFEEAATVFGDPEALDWDDPEHSESELRSKRLGASVSGRILIVSYAPRRLKDGKEIIRIISARQATRKERKAYSG
ncbi:MAG TPA: BrnT family toxin [Candidatus Acidoferrum sp.]|nr:BrnT family toxin [Candidatus Acidoferrum sp.]